MMSFNITLNKKVNPKLNSFVCNYEKYIRVKLKVVSSVFQT